MYNRKASFNYIFLKEYTAGIVLNGPEVKAIRANQCSFVDSYCTIIDGEVFLKKMHINVDKEDDRTRDRKLLLNKKEIRKIAADIKEKGVSLIPVRLYFNKTQLIKVDIALAKGKKLYDKRQSIKERDLKKQNNI